MDELERYVDILFADYKEFEAARALRLAMLNDLLLKKESLQIQGKSEREAIRDVLASLDDLGAPAEGNILVYGNALRRDVNAALVRWLFAGLVLSVPLMVLGSYILTLLLLAALAAAGLRCFRQPEPLAAAEFVDWAGLQQQNRRLVLIWLGFTAVWLLGAALLGRLDIPFLAAPEGSGSYVLALKLARYYPPLVLGVLPLWGLNRTRLLWDNEVGAEVFAEQAAQADGRVS